MCWSFLLHNSLPVFFLTVQFKYFISFIFTLQILELSTPICKLYVLTHQIVFVCFFAFLKCIYCELKCCAKKFTRTRSQRLNHSICGIICKFNDGVNLTPRVVFSTTVCFPSCYSFVCNKITSILSIMWEVIHSLKTAIPPYH